MDEDQIAHRLSRSLHLGPDEVHVVSARLAAVTEADAALLDANEHARASRFILARDREQFIAAHALLRRVLALCLNCAPVDVTFAVTANGKPYLAGSKIGLRFNLSHSGERTMIALAVGRDVGVDVEQDRSVEVLGIAERFFAPSEAAALRSRSPAEQQIAFFRCWTRKEAFIKALGEGLGYPLDAFEVELDDDKSRPLLRRTREERQAPVRWQVRSLQVEPGYAAAVAASDWPWRIIQHEHPGAGNFVDSFNASSSVS